MKSLHNIVTQQFCIYEGAYHFNNSGCTFFDFASARAYCNAHNLDCTDLVDCIVICMTSRYSYLIRRIAEFDKKLQRTDYEIAKLVSPSVTDDYSARIFNNTEIFEQRRLIYANLLHHMEPMVSHALTDDEVVYYALTYLE